jgi:23S rRNA (adenine2503-C2)-methyltransferase
MNEDFGIGARSLCVSTVGVPGGIDRLASVNLQLTLAVSLHCATQSAREELIPSAKNYPLEQLMRDCRDYLERTNRRLSFEVVRSIWMGVLLIGSPLEPKLSFRFAPSRERRR